MHAGEVRTQFISGRIFSSGEEQPEQLAVRVTIHSEIARALSNVRSAGGARRQAGVLQHQGEQDHAQLAHVREVGGGGLETSMEDVQGGHVSGI